MSVPSSTRNPVRGGRVACVKAVSLTNEQSKTRANAGVGAAASFAETENGREQRTQNRPKRGGPGRWRPSQRGPNPRQHWGIRAKKTNRELVGFLNSGGGMGNGTRVLLVSQVVTHWPCGRGFDDLADMLARARSGCGPSSACELPAVKAIACRKGSSARPGIRVMRRSPLPVHRLQGVLAQEGRPLLVLLLVLDKLIGKAERQARRSTRTPVKRGSGARLRRPAVASRSAPARRHRPR